MTFVKDMTCEMHYVCVKGNLFFDRIPMFLLSIHLFVPPSVPPQHFAKILKSTANLSVTNHR